MSNPDSEISAEDREEMITDFEQIGVVVFRVGIDEARFHTLIHYVGENHIPTFTDVDRKAGTVTVTKRPFGSLELF